jgi:two-component system, NtrC family, sensor kinase
MRSKQANRRRLSAYAIPWFVVTERARAVAKGDFTPKSAVDTRDEIGELASTFESMVAAISEARERLLTSERLATIGKMAAHVTHEIRNPLSSISLNLELLQDEMPSQSPEAQSLMKAIQAELDRLTQLTEYYLSFPRTGTFKPEVVDIRSLVSDAIGFMGRDLERRGIQVEVKLADEPLLVSIDEAQLRQALFNVVRNSAEAMPEGGRLQVLVSCNIPTCARIEINDQGKGIAPELAARLFQPFVTNKPNGTGLGLVATQQVVQSHGGTISWEPLLPRGTRFILQFPIAKSPQD